MEEGQFISDQLEEHRRKFEDGDKMAFHLAVLLSIWNGVPVPDWAVPDLEQIIERHANLGKGKKGVVSDACAHKRERQDNRIHWRVKDLMSLEGEEWKRRAGDVPKSLTAAFKAVADECNNASRGEVGAKHHTAAMVKAIYYRIENLGSK